MRRALLSASLVLVLAGGLAPGAAAVGADPGPGDGLAPRPGDAAGLRLDEPRRDVFMDPKLRAEGRTTVNVVLTGESVGEVAADGAAPAQQQERQQEIVTEQAQVMQAVKAADPAATQVAATDTALNSVVVEADVTAIRTLESDPRVASVSVVRHYEMDLSETVPYIGATAVQADGTTGEGVTVAVLDSGVDYTHAAFGGPGTVKGYQQCYSLTPRASRQPYDHAPRGRCKQYFGPGAKVVGGFDFVGETWSPDSDTRYEDPNPIDLEGHGTHVADIIAGAQGVAPGASILAVKVCSAVSSACNGVALIKAMDYVLDPDGDGVTDDKVDIVNMSLGANYGQAFDDDLSQAVEVASANGVLTVASAGNSSDKPFITGTPAAAPSALSVAQTEVPSGGLQLVEQGTSQYAAVFQPWSAPLTAPISGPLTYGDGAGGNLDGCEEFAPGSLSGQVVLVDRGACNFSLKIANIGAGGGELGIIGLVAPGLPFTGANGGDAGADAIPGYMVDQADSSALKAAAGQTVTVDPANISPTVGTVVGSSSRGPAMNGQLLKPEIGAPGASVSAIAGSGSGTEAFGGTSGAAPMVAGAAALLVQAHPGRLPAEYKAVLMNTAETDILNLPAVIGGDLAPVSRIGGGEVRADRAVDSHFAAWNADATSGGLSFGLVEVTGPTTLEQTVTVRNYTDRRTTFRISPELRFEDDRASGAVTPSAPRRIRVPANGTAEFTLALAIDPASLPDWALSSGASGGDGDVLTAMEFDGYVQLTSRRGDLHVPFHVIPRKASQLSQDGDVLTNTGATSSPVELYSLIGTSADLPEGEAGQQDPVPDLRAAGFASADVGCDAGPALLLAATTWERQTHANAPASISFFVDTDRDGVDDFEVFSLDLAGDLSDGRNVTYVADLAAGSSSAFFFTDHQTMSANTVLLACPEQLGLDGTDTSRQVDVTPAVFDLYFTGRYTDTMPTTTIAPFSVPALSGTLPPGASLPLLPGSLLLVRDGAPGTSEAFVVE